MEAPSAPSRIDGETPANQQRVYIRELTFFPNLTLRDHHSVRSSLRRAREETNSSFPSPTSIIAWSMDSVTLSGAWRTRCSRKSSVKSRLRDLRLRRPMCRKSCCETPLFLTSIIMVFASRNCLRYSRAFSSNGGWKRVGMRISQSF
jgi:hypothetical protein